jgi:hypothetical protein
MHSSGLLTRPIICASKTAETNLPGCSSRRFVYIRVALFPLTLQRLSGASLLVFANKTDVENAMSDEEIREVSYAIAAVADLAGLRAGFDKDAQMDNSTLLGSDRKEPSRGVILGR